MNRITRALVAVATAALLTAGLATVETSAAVAAPVSVSASATAAAPATVTLASFVCPSGYACFWTSANYSGGGQGFNLAVGQCVNLSYPYDNNASSWKNTSSTKNYAMYSQYNCSISGSGVAISMPHGSHNANITVGNNDMSSITRIS